MKDKLIKDPDGDAFLASSVIEIRTHEDSSGKWRVSIRFQSNEEWDIKCLGEDHANAERDRLISEINECLLHI